MTDRHRPADQGRPSTLPALGRRGSVRRAPFPREGAPSRGSARPRARPPDPPEHSTEGIPMLAVTGLRTVAGNGPAAAADATPRAGRTPVRAGAPAAAR